MSGAKDRQVVARVAVPDDEELAQAQDALQAVWDKRRKAGRGRPTKYSRLYASLAEDLCSHGATDLELAKQLGVTEKTLNNWKRAHPEFLQAIKVAKETADAKVVNALYQRALGGMVTEWHVVRSGGRTVSTTVTRELSPDTAAAIFWLKNRQRSQWRDRREVAFSRPMINAMNDKETAALVNKIKKYVVKRSKPAIATSWKRLRNPALERPVLREGDRRATRRTSAGRRRR